MRAGMLAAVVALSACGGDHPAQVGSGTAPAAVAATLGGNIVARVADVAVDRAFVLEVARARKISAEQALASVINDALLAKKALAEGAAKDDAVVLRTSTALSRAFLAHLREGVVASSFTDEEIAAATAARWLEVDHPELRNVVHALVKKAVPNGRAVANELRSALLLANGPTAAESEAAFTKAAKEFKVPGGVHVETLRIAEDSRLAEARAAGTVEEPFTKGTFGIPDTFGTSDIVETSYGFHVIRLLERTPPLHLPREQKIEKLKTDLIAIRLRPVHDALVEKLRAATKTEIVAPDALLALPR